MDNSLKESLRGKSLAVATPCYGGMCTEPYLRSMMGLILSCARLSMPFTYISLTNESLITRARNTIVSNFLNTSSTHLMFIDSDISFNPDDVIKLILHNQDVLSGSYPMKGLAIERLVGKNIESVDQAKGLMNKHVINLKPSDTGVYQSVNGLVEVYDAGTGFMMVTREAIEKMIEAYPETRYRHEEDSHDSFALFDTTIDDDGRYLSEDYTFCRRWQKIGGKVWMDPTIILDHFGSYNFEGRQMLKVNNNG